LQFNLEKFFRTTLVRGDCSMNPDIKPEECLFTHPWVADNLDPFLQPNLVDAVTYANRKIMGFVNTFIYSVIISIFVFIFAFRFLVRKRSIQGNQ
jgi:hypothetical protein